MTWTPLRIVGRTLVYAAIAVSLPVLTLALTQAVLLLTDQWYCAPSNWPVC